MRQSYVLDTNVLLALIRGNALGESIDTAYGLRSNLQRHVVSVVSQAELWVLADTLKWSDAKRSALTVMFENLVVLPVDGQAFIDAYVRVSRADKAWPEGARNMGKNDIWIAATAVHTGLPLLTTDKDFQFLHGDVLQVFWIDPNLNQPVIQ